MATQALITALEIYALAGAVSLMVAAMIRGLYLLVHRFSGKG
jgi:hypothetical protein